MALFEVIDPNNGPAPPGPWETRAAPATSFSAGEAQAPVWRVSLPADTNAASGALLAAETQLRRQEAAVDQAPVRLRVLAARGGAASFSTGGGPETRLVALLNSGEGRGAVSFGAGDDGGLAGAQQRFRAFVRQVQDAVGNFAVVETLVEQRLVARSAVSWTGDLRSLLGAELAPAQERLHQRSLGLAMRSRVALLRTFGIVVRGASIVALMATSPAGAIYALPAAWRFVDDLLREDDQ